MIIDYHIEDHMSKRLSGDERRRLKEIAWKNAIKNGSYGSNQGKFFLLYPDGRISEPLDSSNLRTSGWDDYVARVPYQNAFDYGDLDAYAEDLGKTRDDLTDEEYDDFINSVAGDYPPSSFDLEFEEDGDDDYENHYPVPPDGCPRGYHKVNGYRRKDGTYVKEHCARYP
jgi:hypothetical protein